MGHDAEELASLKERTCVGGAGEGIESEGDSGRRRIRHLSHSRANLSLMGACLLCAVCATPVATLSFDARHDSETSTSPDMSSDNEDLRPQKRLRTAEDAPSEPSISSPPSNGDLNTGNLTRHEEFWFDDGSVVLVAQNTAFRVFRTLLAAQSTVFADMLSSSSPNAEEMFEGCPVVHLSDSPQDAAHLLHVLLPKSQRTYVLHPKLSTVVFTTQFAPHTRLYAREPLFSFPQISAIIRLAHKYHVQDVLDQAVLALEEYFTSDFATWDSDGIAVAFKPRHAIAVVNLARLVDIPSLLPVAFYECALLGGGIFKGYRRADVVRCIEGRNKLAAKAVAFISDVFVTDSCAKRERRGRCKSALKTMLEDAIGSDDASDPDVLNGWEHAIKDWAKELRLCGLCEKAALDRDTAARRRVWDELPNIFGIKVEGWNSMGDESGGGDAAVVAPAV